MNTVESPNNGHVGDMASACCRELSASRRLVHLFIKTANMHHFECSFICIQVKQLREQPQVRIKPKVYSLGINVFDKIYLHNLVSFVA